MKQKSRLDVLAALPNFHLIAILFFLLLITGCATVTKDIEVIGEVATDFNVSEYKTYAWLGSAKILYDPEGKWEPPKFYADGEVKWLIGGELRKRGMIEVEENPDVLVVFAAGVDMSALQLAKDPVSKIKMLENIPVGALAVMFIDASSGQAVWAGVATGDIQESLLSKSFASGSLMRCARYLSRCHL